MNVISILCHFILFRFLVTLCSDGVWSRIANILAKVVAKNFIFTIESYRVLSILFILVVGWLFVFWWLVGFYFHFIIVFNVVILVLFYFILFVIAHYLYCYWKSRNYWHLSRKVLSIIYCFFLCFLFCFCIVFRDNILT